MGRYRITHTRKDGADADRRIDALMIDGYVYHIDQVIDWINSQQHTLYVEVAGRNVGVVTDQHPSTRRWYLTTQADGFPPNNLLRLPNC